MLPFASIDPYISSSSVAMESNHDLIVEWKGLVCLDAFELEVVTYFKLLP
jgi:hypothetical protein